MIEKILILFRKRRLPHKYYIMRRNACLALLNRRIEKSKLRGFLSPGDLEELVELYEPKRDYKFDAESVSRRGKERAEELKNKFTFLLDGKSCEIGCGDGMVSYHLSNQGCRSLAIDKSNWLDRRILESNVEFHKEYVEAGLTFDSDLFDLVFSYNAMEHFPDP